MSWVQTRYREYLDHTHWILVTIDVIRAVALIVAVFASGPLVAALAQRDDFQAVLHRRIFNNPDFASARGLYLFVITTTGVLTALWVTTAARNLARLTALRNKATEKAMAEFEEEKLELPPNPFKPEAFAVVLGELQDRDGSRVPSPKEPELLPRWLVLSEKALFTGILVTGSIGSGKTAAVADPGLDQMIQHRREILVRRNGQEYRETMQWSGLVMDEKGDFCAMTAAKMEKYGRAHQFIRLAPGGPIKWNIIYNPAIPTWAIGYQLGQLLRKFNKGASGSDPFWENAPRELVIDYLTLLDDARGYYTLSDYLEVLVSPELQDQLNEMAMERHRRNPAKIREIERRWRNITNRREEMSEGLRGSLQACAKAGLALFQFPEIRATFCPSKEEYFTEPFCPWPKRKPRNAEEEALFEQEHEQGIVRPRDNVFPGFDAVLDQGIIVGLDMPKTMWFDAASFVQVALKSQWQDAVLRRDTRTSEGALLVPPRFGEKVGYCPTFLMSDECQANVVPSDQEFMAQCRSKRASCWWLTQSHKSIFAAMGQDKKSDAETFFVNTMTHIYLRQSDIESMEIIGKEAGNKDVAKLSVAVSEGGQKSQVSYVHGQIINDGLAVTETRTSNIEEKPFFEIDQLKTLPNFVAVVFPSTGEETLPGTICFLRPSFLFRLNPDLRFEVSYLDWPQHLKKRTTLANLPQELKWEASKEAVDLDDNASTTAFLGGFVGVRVMADRPGLEPGGATPAPVVVAEEKEMDKSLDLTEGREPSTAAAEEEHEAPDAPKPKQGLSDAERQAAERQIQQALEEEVEEIDEEPSPKAKSHDPLPW